MNELELSARWFDNPAHYARFLGVSESTLFAWFKGTTHPTSAALRLLEVFARLESANLDLHASLVDATREPGERPTWKQPRRVRTPQERHREMEAKAIRRAEREQRRKEREKRHKVKRETWLIRDLHKQVAPAVVPVARPTSKPRMVPVDAWDDAYWFERTVSHEEWLAGEPAPVADRLQVCRKMSEAEEDRYLASLSEYERRTGRKMPDDS